MIEWVELWNESHTSETDRGHGLGHKALPISVEVEKPRVVTQDLIPLADVLFVSKEFAEFRGCTTMSETLRNLAQDAKPR